MQQTVDALWICIYISPMAARERGSWCVYLIFCVRPLHVCSFYFTGHYQSLRTWDEQQVRLSRFLYNHIFTVKVGEPCGNIIVHSSSMATKHSSIPSSVAHYTSVDVLRIILEGALGSEKGEFTMHLSHLAMMNDAKEGAYILDQYYTGSNKKNIIQQEWENEYLPQHTPFVLSTIKTDNETNGKGSLPMWKMYGDDFRGAFIRFRFNALKKYCDENNLLLAPCEYKTTNECSELIKQLNGADPDFDKLLRKSCLTKNQCWEYENEWRIVATRTIDDIKVKSTARGVVQYIELKFPIDLIDEICLGPMSNSVFTKPSLTLMKDKLSKKFDGQVHFKITSSNINIR